MTDTIRAWVEESAYGAGLGVGVDEVSEEQVRLRLPYQEANSNPGDALHGGCAASLGLIGGQAVARAALGEEMGPFHTAACHVSYLSAAIGEDVVAATRLLRRGKAMVFSETSVQTAEGKPISHVASLVRGRAGEAPPATALARGDDGAADPGEMGPFVGSMPFTAARQLTVEHMVDSYSRIVMPVGDANGDLDGGFHEGAALALLDTTGAMAAWADTGPGPYKASTASMQAQVVAPLHAENLVGFGIVSQRDGDLFWADVEIADAVTMALLARGLVVYRIIT